MKKNRKLINIIKINCMTASAGTAFCPTNVIIKVYIRLTIKLKQIAYKEIERRIKKLQLNKQKDQPSH